MACNLGGPKTKLCGYCRLHRSCMTVNQLQRRECLKKQCRHLKKLDHPYWEQREQVKAKRKERKERLDAYAEAHCKGVNTYEQNQTEAEV